MVVECKACEALVEGLQLKSYEQYDPEEGPPYRYTFLKCPKCSSPFLVVQENYGEGYDDPATLYPPQEVHVNPALPDAIRVAYAEAIACQKARAFTATAIMCRKTLEGICAEHGITTRNLGAALKEMKEKGAIESRLYEWADALRISGNEAAHDVKVIISKEDAKDILEFTHALLEYVFTFRDKFEEFRKRRARQPDA